jgi:hypothetical protein
MISPSNKKKNYKNKKLAYSRGHRLECHLAQGHLEHLLVQEVAECHLDHI